MKKHTCEKLNDNNRSNQLNPNNPQYYRDRGMSLKAASCAAKSFQPASKHSTKPKS